MNKTILHTSLILCLLCSTFSKAQTSGFIIPANAYSLSSNAGTFTDIADNPGTVKLGADLAAETDLKNGFFINSSATPFVTHTADSTQNDPGFALGFNFNLCGKTMTHFTVCASGGIHFSGNTDVIQAQSSAWIPWSTAPKAKYTNLISTSIRNGNGNESPLTYPKSITGQAPVMYLIDGEEGAKTLTVQYHYSVNGDAWTYQIKAHENGNIEFVMGDIAAANATNGQYRFFMAFVENGGQISGGRAVIFDDPFGSDYMNLTNKYVHRLGITQTANDYTDHGWDAISAYIGTASTPVEGLYISSVNGPEKGRTLTVSMPEDCNGTVETFNDDWYGFSTTTITATSFTGKIAFDKDQITPDEMTAAGTLVAVLSTSETPDYTLADGSWYRNGDKPNATSQVLLNAKPTFYIDTDGKKFTSLNAQTLSANGLTADTRYYIHIYAMDFRCTGAPVYSGLCRTFSLSTSLNTPQTLTAGLPTTSSVPLTVKPANGLGVVLLKSQNTNTLQLSGKLNAGDKIGEAEVLTVIESDNETVFDAPFEAGEGAYVLAYSVKNPDAESPVYGQDFLTLSVRAAYDILPQFRFDNEPYTSPKPDEYGRLPFGWSRETEFPANQHNQAFRLAKIDEDDEAICLSSGFPTGTEDSFWADVVTPAFACPAGTDKIMATFYFSYAENAGFSTTSHKPTAEDNVRIEYSVDGNAWQTVMEMNGLDEDFPQLNTNGQYPLSATIAGLSPNSIIRLRYSYNHTYPITGATAQIYNYIHAVDIVEGKDCLAPKAIQLVDSLTTNERLTIHWLDDNLPVAPNFVLAYQNVEEATWHYTRMAATANSGNDMQNESSLTGLNAGTIYRIKVAALCGFRDSSFYTEPLTARTAFNLPYKESMAKTGSGDAEQTPFDRGVKTYSGAIGRQLTEETGTNWNQNRTSDPNNAANAVSVGDFVTDAWLMIPAVYIRENGDFTPKSLNFTLTGFDNDKTKGVAPNYNDTKLKILVSGNGLFTQDDIVQTLDADQLALNEQAFTIDLTEWEGFLQVAFVFECPSGVQTSSEDDGETEDRPDPWYLEIKNLSIQYDVDICFPVENLSHSVSAYEIPLTWSASVTAVEYGIFWKLSKDTEYSAENAAYTKETSYTITGLKDGTRYKAIVVAYCDENRTLASEPTEDIFSTLTGCHTPQNFHIEDITATGANFISTSDQPDFISHRIVYITPDNGGKIFTIIQEFDTLCVRDSLTKLTAYTATTQAVCEDTKSEMSEAIHFTTTDRIPSHDSTINVEAIAQLNGCFIVRTQDGQIAIRNLNSLLVRNVSVYNLSGAKLANFRTDSRDDLLLAVNARRTLIFVRLQTERGTAVYKVYIQ